VSARPDLYDKALERASTHARDWLASVPGRAVPPQLDADAVVAALGGPFPEGPTDPADVVDLLARHVEPALMAMPSGRFFGWVIGGTLPAALAADWLVSAWDQNTGMRFATPGTTGTEEVAGGWLLEALGLPGGSDVGFVTGGTMANWTGLAAGRQQVLTQAGWDLDGDGLTGAPKVHVLVGEDRHATVDLALRYLGLGRPTAVAADEQGRIVPAALRSALEAVDGPTIVALQAGNLHSGSFDPFAECIELAHQHGAWVHVDGAFGLWAAASPRLRPLVAGVGRADSWATDAHKWLNVPYDCGLVFCADPQAHRAAMGARAGYLVHGSGGERDALDHNPEHSRRARGFAVYAALRALGRGGVADLVERSCTLARRFATQLGATLGVTVLNDVVLNQVLVRFLAGSDRDSDDLTRTVVERVQHDGTCWMSGTVWQGRAAMRISVSNWSTDEADVDRSVAAILRCAREAA